MRVIAGSAKGRTLASVRGFGTRPMTDQIREAMFSTIGSRVVGALFLDLYAGSGAVGIEALSRGAEGAVFVEQDREAAATIRKNLASTHLGGSRAAVSVEAVDDYLRSETGFRFGIVVLDPPFEDGVPGEVLQALGSGDLLEPDHLVILRVHKRTPADVPAPWRVVGERRYGDSTLIYMKIEEEA